jgi:peroxiredoxin
MRFHVLPLACALCVAFSASAKAADATTETNRPEVGDKAPNFDLPIVGSKEEEYLQLDDEVKQGAVVVIVLRGFPGYQCPLCSRQVGALINRAKALAEAAHRVILVYPGEPDLLQRHADEFVGSRAMPSPIVMVRDPGMKMVTDWGLRWDAPRETAYPATYIIKKNGRIAWSKISTSHAGRTTADEIINELRKL